MSARLPCVVAILLTGCSATAPVSPMLGQGTIAGEVTTTSVLLQTRLTEGNSLNEEHQLAGADGVAGFEIADNAWFVNSTMTAPHRARGERDFIVRQRVGKLRPDTRYYYRALFGATQENLEKGSTGYFRTLPGTTSASPVSMVFSTCFNYYHFHHGKYDASTAYSGPDKSLGYPGLTAMLTERPDYVVFNGDNVYYDHPVRGNVDQALQAGRDVDLSPFDGEAVGDVDGMRRKYQEQFVQTRYHDLWSHAGAYFLKDDHDYRFNDAYPAMETPISHEHGVATFREQVPVVEIGDSSTPTYRTHVFSADLQVWFLEGRDYRSANTAPDGPVKSLWGTTQRSWLQKTLLESGATYKILVSPTPLVGPDDAYKRDNHTNHGGFRYEGEAFFRWLTENGFDRDRIFIVTGDRHWQYHSVHPSGFQEFSSGAIDTTNARTGRVPGDPDSTDPDAVIEQIYVQDEAGEVSGGFLMLETRRESGSSILDITFIGQGGEELHSYRAATKIDTGADTPSRAIPEAE